MRTMKHSGFHVRVIPLLELCPHAADSLRMKLYQEGIDCSLDVKDVAGCYRRRLTDIVEEPVFRSGAQRGYWTTDFVGNIYDSNTVP